MTPKSERLIGYQSAYRSQYGFESVMVAARQRLVLEMLAAIRPPVVVEIGCGADLLVEKAVAAGGRYRRWVIVEPGAEFASGAQLAAAQSGFVRVVAAFAEEAVNEVLAEAGGRADFVICSSVLHEVEDPSLLLGAAKELLSPSSGVLHVNVPNARSLHRRLAVAMKMIADEHELTDRNRVLAQYRVFDLATLVEIVAAAGFVVEASGGYLLKPFAHSQMETLGFLTEEILDGLFFVGQDLPELASEIYVNARVGS